MSALPTPSLIRQQLDQYLPQLSGDLLLLSEVFDWSAENRLDEAAVRCLIEHASMVLSRCVKLANEALSQGGIEDAMGHADAHGELVFAATNCKALCMAWINDGCIPYSALPMSNIIWSIRNALERAMMWRSTEWQDWQRDLFMCEQETPWGTQPAAPVPPTVQAARRRTTRKAVPA